MGTMGRALVSSVLSVVGGSGLRSLEYTPMGFGLSAAFDDPS